RSKFVKNAMFINEAWIGLFRVEMLVLRSQDLSNLCCGRVCVIASPCAGPGGSALSVLLTCNRGRYRTLRRNCWLQRRVVNVSSNVTVDCVQIRVFIDKSLPLENDLGGCRFF